MARREIWSKMIYKNTIYLVRKTTHCRHISFPAMGHIINTFWPAYLKNLTVNNACYARTHIEMPLACSHLMTVVSKHAQNKNSPAHLHMQIWNLKDCQICQFVQISHESLHFNVLSAALGLTWSWAILKLDFTGHNSQVSFSRNIRNSSKRVLQGYKEKWQEVGFCQMKTLCHSTYWKWNGLAKTVQGKVDQRRRLEVVSAMSVKVARCQTRSIPAALYQMSTSKWNIIKVHH